jgi:hypothetical protein
MAVPSPRGYFCFWQDSENSGYGWDLTWVLCCLTFVCSQRPPRHNLDSLPGQVDECVSTPHLHQVCGVWEFGGQHGLEVCISQQQHVGGPEQPSLLMVGYCCSKVEPWMQHTQCGFLVFFWSLLVVCLWFLQQSNFCLSSLGMFGSDSCWSHSNRIEASNHSVVYG